MQKTDLNVDPYYDDFDEADNFHRILFRPGFAVQARELTQLQSILQNQIERHGRHFFKEGTVVIPGSIGFTDEYYAVKLQSTFGGDDISGYISSYVGAKITGQTSGVVAEVIEAVAASGSDPITLYVKYIGTGSDNITTVFANGEEIAADVVISGFIAGASSATTTASDATATGSSANITEGVFFIRGNFVQVSEQRLILDKYTNQPSYRIGLEITESLVTPEQDTELLDNAQGSSNFAAKGAHRLKISAALAKKELGSADDANFIELMRLQNGVIQEAVRNTEYSVLGETMARRTFDESGDYTVRTFDFDVRENLNDGTNNGIYVTGATTDDGNTASEDLLTLQISPGKAYVRGYEIDIIAPRFLDVPKPRTFSNFNGAVTPVEVGNFANVSNAYGAPDLSPLRSGEIDEPYRTISLFDTQTATRGSSSGDRIGFARARAIEHTSGNAGSGSDFLADSSTTDSQFKLYLFDIRMFTKLTLSGTPSPSVATGAKITGVNSGAYGYVASDSTGTALYLTSVVGAFSAGEKVKSTSSSETDEILENSSNTDLTISSIDTFSFENAKQAFMDDPDAGHDFTADLVLDNERTINGFVSSNGSTTALNGFSTAFTTELKVGDVIAIPSGSSGALEERTIAGITSDTSATLDSATSNAVTSVSLIRRRAKLNDQNKNVLLRKLQKNTLKTLKTENNGGVSDTTITVRRQFVVSSNSSGEIAISAGANETFNAASNTDYVVTVLTAGTGGSGAAGDVVNVDSSNVTVSGTGTANVTITSSAIFGNNAKVKVSATITRSVVNEKTKSRTRSHLVLADNDGIAGAAEYGTSAHHREISLGVADVYRLRAVFESNSASTDPALPQFSISGAITGAFVKGETIIGATSGAKGIIVNTTDPITYVLIGNSNFSTGETVTGQESGATATLGTYTAGSTVVTNSYTLDTGMRDNYYDIARIVRKSTAPAATGKLLIVCDYFTHGSGDFFSVDSYSAIDYKDIPTYTATRVDPEVREPTGEYDLRDTVDFRPRVADSTQTTTVVQGQTAYKVTGFSFNFEARDFSGTGASTIDIPKDNSNFLYDFDHYLGRIDMVFLTAEGNFKLVSGSPSEQPIAPKPLENAMKLATINLNPYLISLEDASLSRTNNRRYTMRDIGKLETRIQNIEYYTSLNLLEKEAQSLQIQDSNGLDRFKSGFVVDNFKGHAVGDVKHPDYRVAIDMSSGVLRPKYYMKGISLTEENLTDADRTGDNYAKTGDVVTLPYTHQLVVQQPYATRVENLNPVLNFSWSGICTLSPSGDEWFEVDRLPDLIINREGNFDTVLAANRNSLGTVWNAWQTQWSGVSETVATTRFRETSWARARRQVPFRPVIQRSTVQEAGVSSRTGIQTTVVPQIDEESQGDRIVSRAVIPFIRSRNITFTATGLKPRTKVYAYFDKTNVGAYCTPDGGSLGDSLITNGAGKIIGTFNIPNPNIDGNPRFRTGERVFRLTSDADNGTSSVETFAQTIYSATGILNTVQETIIATRNARVETREVSQTQNVVRQDTRDEIVGWWDPLAQSFMPQAKGGEYITKVEAFFQKKDTEVPVTCQIREMSNGYPTTKVLPFGSKSLEPSEVSVSDDASVPTAFTFDSPVYVKEGVEYCIVLFTDSLNYLAWISRMGEVDVGGSRLVSEQPYLGVLFKSQNNSTWTAFDFEDLKFNLYRAKFNTGVTGRLTLTNDDLVAKTLESNPVQTFNGASKVKINHRDHQMYASANNVVITGVTGNRSGSILQLSSVSLDSGSLPADATYDDVATSGGTGSDATVKVVVSGSAIASVLMKHPGEDYVAGDTLTITNLGGSTNSITFDVDAVGETLGGLPVAAINTTHTTVTDQNIDYYTVSPDTTSYDVVGTAIEDTVGGGSSITATENALFDTLQTLLSVVEHPDTTLTGSVRTTSSTSPNGTQTSFNLATNGQTIPLNDNFDFGNPKMVASPINENNEMAGVKSFRLDLTMNTDVDNLSPYIDLDRKSIVCVANRINNIDSDADVYPASSFAPPTDPDGDLNEVVYVTRKVQLANPATSIRLIFDAVRLESAEIQAMFKILRSDDASDFDEIGWTYFNTDGTPDSNVNPSTTLDDFLEYEYTADGLDEFISFAIKIRMQSTNCAEPPLVKDLRAIALAT